MLSSDLGAFEMNQGKIKAFEVVFVKSSIYSTCFTFLCVEFAAFLIYSSLFCCIFK